MVFELFGSWLIRLPVTALIIFGIIFLMTRGRRKMLKTCYILFAISCFFIFLIYSSCYLSSDLSIANIFISTFRGIFSTARAFHISDDYGYISGTKLLLENIWINTLLWFCYVLAMSVSVSAVIAFFGGRIIDKLRMRWDLHSGVFIISGTNRNALILGKNLATHDGKWKRPDPDRLIVFLTGKDDDNDGIYKRVQDFGAMSVSVDDNSDVLRVFDETGFGKFYGKKKKFNLIIMKNSVLHTDDVKIILDYAKTKAIKHENLELYVFASEEWERDIISNLSAEKEKAADSSQTRKYPFMLHLVDELEIITRQLINICSPYKCLANKKVFTKARSKKDFTVLVLGFGETGCQSFLRLVLNGQFLDSSMQAIIADTDITIKYDRFLQQYPSINISCDIQTMQADVFGKQFYEKLSKNAISKNIDYIIIALGEESANKKAAIEVRRYYLKTGDTPAIAVFSGYEPYKNDNIFSFGLYDHVYDEANIILEELDRLSMNLQIGYDREKIRKNRNESIKWHELNWFNQESLRAQMDFIHIIIELAEFTEEQTKNLRNWVFDKKAPVTQEVIADLKIDTNLAEALAETEHRRWNAFHVVNGYSPIKIEEMRKKWNAFHDVNGWSPAGNEEDCEKWRNEERKCLTACRKDTSLKMHLCLDVWDKLDELSAAYHELDPGYPDFKIMDYDIFKKISGYLNIKNGNHSA
jgi:hypothetical protein